MKDGDHFDFADECWRLCLRLRTAADEEAKLAAAVAEITKLLSDLSIQRWRLSASLSAPPQQVRCLSEVINVTSDDITFLFDRLSNESEFLAKCLIDIQHFGGSDVCGAFIESLFNVVFASATGRLNEMKVTRLLMSIIDHYFDVESQPISAILSNNQHFLKLFGLLVDSSHDCQLFMISAFKSTVIQVLTETNLPLNQAADLLLMNVENHLNSFPKSIASLLQHIYSKIRRSTATTTNDLAIKYSFANLIFGSNFVAVALCDPVRYGLTPYPITDKKMKFSLVQVAKYLQSQCDPSRGGAENLKVIEIITKILSPTPPQSTAKSSEFIDRLCLFESRLFSDCVITSLESIRCVISGLVHSQGVIADFSEAIGPLLSIIFAISERMNGTVASSTVLVIWVRNVDETVANVLEMMNENEETIGKLRRGSSLLTNPLECSSSLIDACTNTDHLMGNSTGSEKRTRFVVPPTEQQQQATEQQPDQADAASSNDHLSEINIFEPSEIASTRSGPSIGLSDASSSDALSDVVSANVSGRESPAVSGRETPMSHVSSSLPFGCGDDEHRPLPPNIPVTISKNDTNNMDEMFGKFSGLCQGTKSYVSDCWSEQALASDSEDAGASAAAEPTNTSLEMRNDGQLLRNGAGGAVGGVAAQAGGSGSQWSIEVQWPNDSDIANMSDITTDDQSMMMEEEEEATGGGPDDYANANYLTSTGGEIVAGCFDGDETDLIMFGDGGGPVAAASPGSAEKFATSTLKMKKSSSNVAEERRDSADDSMFNGGGAAVMNSSDQSILSSLVGCLPFPAGQTWS